MLTGRVLFEYPNAMRIRVLLFGVLKDILQRSSDVLELPDGATLADLLDRYRQQAPEHANLWTSVALSVNQQYARSSQILRDGDEVGLLPPVSGGASDKPKAAPQAAMYESARSEHCQIVTAPIATDAVLAQIKQGEDGAAIVFEGIVRNNTKGRRTLYLDYEAYQSMALRQMEELARQALERFKIRELRMVHRLGRLQIGETSVLIAVASAHRAAAFDACRFLIDTLKKTVPIWKKEYFEDGAVWADGEPFPDELRQI